MTMNIHIESLTRKVFALFSVIILEVPINVFGQSNNIVDSSDVAKARVDYAVPDAPASKILDGGFSDIMRPATVRDIAVAISTMDAKGGALEISPWLIFGDSTLSSYRNNRFLYRMRLSAGINLNDNGTKEYGMGIRLTIIDDADLRTDSQYTSKLIQIGHIYGQIELDCSREIKIDPVKDPVRYGEAMDSCIKARTLNESYEVDAIIKKERDQAKQENWNKTLLEVGLATSALTTDSTVRNLQAEKYGLWSTIALPLFGTHGQLVCGGKALAQRDSDRKFNNRSGSLNARGYIGNNSYKGFLEGGWMGNTDQIPAYNIDIGTELRIGNGTWVEVGVGITKTKGEDAKINSTFNVRLASPEINK
jgi:hypothetical protein